MLSHSGKLVAQPVNVTHEHWSLCSLVFVLSVACSASSPTLPDSTSPPRIVVLGDSLTAGIGLAQHETFPSRLQERVRTAGLSHVVVNEGVSGDTTADALRRLDRALAHGPEVLVVALGANDGLQGVPVATVERNLQTIIERARERNIKVLLCGMETLPSRGWEYTLDFHAIYPALAERHRIPLMPFLLAGVVGRPELNLADGWHPNAAGMRIIADNLWPYLEPLLR
jgi:acyl-CoA thioesterase I